MSKRWITMSGYVIAVPGQIGFLAEHYDVSRDLTTHWDIRPDPIRTIGTRHPLLYGGAGVYNNKTWLAHGLARVLKVSANGDRVFIEDVDPGSPDGQAFLNRAGFPQFIPEEVT